MKIHGWTASHDYTLRTVNDPVVRLTGNGYSIGESNGAFPRHRVRSSRRRGTSSRLAERVRDTLPLFSEGIQHISLYINARGKKKEPIGEAFRTGWASMPSSASAQNTDDFNTVLREKAATRGGRRRLYLSVSFEESNRSQSRGLPCTMEL